MTNTSSLPRLTTASFESLEQEVTYKSGASFKGKVIDLKKVGRGIFTWPNGASYEGDFTNNIRSGQGLQIWPDGSSYQGDFVDDLRHGHGRHTWANGEIYEGSFFRDRRHGSGVYKWPDGASYTGSFYIDRKEGYGVFQFANGDIFEGLYHEDERDGPGAVTYEDGRQDVGLWQGEHLIKLCTSVPGAFTMMDHKEFDFDPEQHQLFINVNDRETSLSKLMEEPQNIFDYLPATQVNNKLEQFFSDSLDPQSLAVNRDAFDKEYFKNQNNSRKLDDDKVLAWNRTPSMIELQLHVHKHHHSQNQLEVDMSCILNGDRSSFNKKGPIELAAEELLRAALAGESDIVEMLLHCNQVHPDVADVHGHTALIGAAVGWHMKVINILLNHGADVNKLNDEGCSALSIATVYYYPISAFRYNIAERYLEKPPEVNIEPVKLETQPKGILSKKRTRKSSSTNSARSRKSSAVKPEVLPSGAEKRKQVLPSGVSSTSIDSGFQNMDSLSPEKSLVRISETVSEENNGFDSEIKDDDDNDSVLGTDIDLVEEQDPEDFESTLTLRNYEIEVTDQLLVRCATQLSTNDLVVGRSRSQDSYVQEKTIRLALEMSEHEQMKTTLDLLLLRGADPNASSVPMPVLFFAIKAADVEMARTLLLKGASTTGSLPAEKGGLSPLHISVAIPGEEGPVITELLLNALAHPDIRATEDDSFLIKHLMDEWSKDLISDESLALLGGRTPLQIACAREDNYQYACQVVHLLLEHKANPNLLCNGFSPLALAIASGNDLAIDELLLYGADPSLALTHGVGSALCVASSTEFEHKRIIQARVQLIDKLINAGANILTPIQIGPKRVTGTAIDHAFYMFNQDRRIAHMPYHALTYAERETYNSRRRILGHVGEILRNKAVERERRRLEDEARGGLRSASPSTSFVYTGAGAGVPGKGKGQKSGLASDGHVSFDPIMKDKRRMKPSLSEGEETRTSKVVSVTTTEAKLIRDARSMRKAKANIRKPLFKYCYECGRSVGVRLSACTRCKEVYYCSKACKLKAWNTRHKEECIRVGGKSRSPSPAVARQARSDSPTPATNPDIGKPGATVAELNKDKNALRIHVPVKGKSQSAKGERTQGQVTFVKSQSAKGYRSKPGKQGSSRSSPGRCESPELNAYVDNYSFV